MRNQAISPQKCGLLYKQHPPWKRSRQLLTKALAAELPFPQGICTVPRSASLGYECLRAMHFFCLGWLHGRPWKRRFLFGGTHYCQVPCWSNQLCSWFHPHILGNFWMKWSFHKRFLHLFFQPRHYNMFDGTLAISTPEMCPGHQRKTHTHKCSLKQSLLTCEHKISCVIPRMALQRWVYSFQLASPSNMGA